MVVIWTALLLTILLGFAGWAVDYSHWNQEGDQMQKAADAAALAGAVFLPDNYPLAESTARDVATKNGFTNGVDGTTVSVALGKQPNQLKVSIRQPIKSYFAQVVGISSADVGRHGVGEYQRPVTMGSPINQFGNDPESGAAHGSARYPDFWTNVFGPSSQKAKGDAIQSTICGGADNCSSGNSDYDPNGYFYGIDVDSSAGPLDVQAFDPAFAHVGDNCGANDNGSNLAAAAALPPNFNPTFAVTDPATRYSPADTSPFCTGDMLYSEGNNVLPWTVYTVRGPDSTSADPTNNPILCQVEFPGFKGDLAAALTATTPQPGAPATFVKYFRQWYSLCKVSNPSTGTYFLQIQTKTKINGGAAPNGGGANRLALRATLAGNKQTTRVRVYGFGRIGIYANSPKADTNFYLARVLPGAQGRTLVMNFFDVGDAAQPGEITVLPPSESNVSGGAFSGCTYTPPPGNSTGPPWGTLQNTLSGCRITGVSSATFNGQWVQFRIPIPNDYTCDFNDPMGCWLRVRFNFTDRVSDTTTWNAQLTGDPVRLIE